jgi:hypothetical protein
VSTLNSFNGAVVANAAIVPAGTNGSVSAFVSDSSDLILDINGSSGLPSRPDGLHFYPVLPCRVVDTRSGLLPPGTTGSGPIVNGSRTFPLTQQWGVPASAKALALNVTAVPGSPLFFLTLWPAGLPQPEVSTLNSFDAQVVANLALIPTGQNGAISAYALGATDLVLDVIGYFAQ